MTGPPPHLSRLDDGSGILTPRSPEDVAAVLRHASEKSLAVQVIGGGTRSGYGSPPSPDIRMSTEGLASVETWEPDDLTIVVQPGVKVAEIEKMLSDRNQSAVLPEVPGDSTIGGVIAAGVSSFKRGRFYATRERILESTVVTGDGRIVRSGGRVVKNVTGYDLPRLMVGAFGSLGVIVSVCLKLLPTPKTRATVSMESPEQADVIARPLAVLSDRSGVKAFLWGTPEEVAAQAERLGGPVESGHAWPADPDGLYRWSLRVPPSVTETAIGRIPDSWAYVALHGVGEIRAASSDRDGADELRAWAEGCEGRLVVVDAPDGAQDGFDPWGTPPPALQVQRRLIAQFDPARIINPGRLPAGL